jgi:hypothetical protein
MVKQQSRAAVGTAGVRETTRFQETRGVNWGTSEVRGHIGNNDEADVELQSLGCGHSKR